jgi:hypothetical protein
LLATLILMLSGGISRAQFDDSARPEYNDYYPIHAKGYVNSPFAGSEFDNINLFNGNLTASIPLGPTLHAGGDARLQLALHYNSKIWDESRKRRNGCGTTTDCGRQGMGTLLGTVHAGLGWTLELGHISTPGLDVMLHTADGAQHQLFNSRFGAYGGYSTREGEEGMRFETCDWSVESTCYTRDGTDIKVKREPESDSYYYVASFPDGTIRTYKEIPDSGTVKSRDLDDTVGRLYCTEIKDQWGHSITISYYSETYDAVHDRSEVAQVIPESIVETTSSGTELRRVELTIERPTATIPTETIGDDESYRKPARITSGRLRARHSSSIASAT